MKNGVNFCTYKNTKVMESEFIKIREELEEKYTNETNYFIGDSDTHDKVVGTMIIRRCQFKLVCDKVNEISLYSRSNDKAAEGEWKEVSYIVSNNKEKYVVSGNEKDNVKSYEMKCDNINYRKILVNLMKKSLKIQGMTNIKL